MSARVSIPLAAAGCAGAALAIVAGRRAYTGTTRPSTNWFGLLAPTGYRPGDSPVWGLLLFAGIAIMTAAWLVAIRWRDRLAPSTGWLIAAAWAAPLIVGPPLISKDVFAYSAHGLMQRHGLDVYRVGVSALAHVPGGDRAVAAVDPRWREVGSPYGPLATGTERLADFAGGGQPLATLIVLRVVALIGVVAVVLLATRLADDRMTAFVLVALNPVVLVHALSAAHVEAVMVALLLAGLVAARAQRFELAVVLCVFGGLVKAPALLGAALVVLEHVRCSSRRVRTLAQDAAVVVLAFVVPSLLVPDGFGWVRNLTTPSGGDATASITGTVRKAADAIAPDAVGTGVVVLGALAAFGVVSYLAATIAARPLAQTVGWALIAVAFLAPVTYPWYVLWGGICLLATLRPGTSRDVMIALCVVESLASIPGAPGLLTGSLSAATIVTAVVVVLVRRRGGLVARVPATVRSS